MTSIFHSALNLVMRERRYPWLYLGSYPSLSAILTGKLPERVFSRVTPHILEIYTNNVKESIKHNRHTSVHCIFNNYSSSPNGLWVNSPYSEAEGRMGYCFRSHEGERNNCFSKIRLVGQKYRDKTTLASKTRRKSHCFAGAFRY